MEKLKTYWFSNPLRFIVYLLGVIFFSYCLFLAFIFFKERTLAIDSANFSFHLIQTKTFFTPLNRYGSIFTQIIPLLFLKGGCSLITFLKIYSINIFLLYFVGFFIITFVLKNYKVGLIYILTICLTNRFTFYFSIYEFAQGLSLVVLLYAFIEHLIFSKKRKHIVFLICVALITGLYYFHQLLIIPIVFCLGFSIIYYKKYNNYKLWLLLSLGIIWFGIKLLLLPKNGYESNKIPSFEIIQKEIFNFYNLPSFDYFAHMFYTEYIPAFILLIISTLILFKKKQLLTSIFIITSILGYLLLITLTYYLGESPNMYDQYFIVFGFFISFSFIGAFFNELKKQAIVLIIPILFYSCYSIYEAHEMPSKRIEYLETLVANGKKYKSKKYIIHPDDFSWGYGWTGWALPIETLLISSLDDNDNSVTFYLGKPEEVELYLEKGQLHAEPWNKSLMNTRVLDPKYFNLPEKTAYQHLKRRPHNHNYYYEKIKYNYQWMKSIKRKANKRNLSVEEMINKDAAWMVEREQLKNEK